MPSAAALSASCFTYWCCSMSSSCVCAQILQLQIDVAGLGVVAGLQAVDFEAQL